MSNPTTTNTFQDNGPATGEPPPESLDKVRDILFGGQMRAVESRLQGLESRLLQAQDSLRAEFTRQLEELDSSLHKEAHALAERLSAERTKRTEELKALGAELKEMLRSLEKRHLKLEETSGMADADLREGILEQSKAVHTELTRLSDRFADQLQRSVEELKADKASLASLASLFSDVAARLDRDARGVSQA